MSKKPTFDDLPDREVLQTHEFKATEEDVVLILHKDGTVSAKFPDHTEMGQAAEQNEIVGAMTLVFIERMGSDDEFAREWLSEYAAPLKKEDE